MPHRVITRNPRTAESIEILSTYSSAMISLVACGGGQQRRHDVINGARRPQKLLPRIVFFSLFAKFVALEKRRPTVSVHTSTM